MYKEIHLRLKANLPVLEILGHLLIWFILIIITLGIALFFFPYSFAKFVLNRTSVIDSQGVERRFTCEIDIMSNIGHIILWIIISIFTLGIGYFFYVYRVWGYALRNTRVM